MADVGRVKRFWCACELLVIFFLSITLALVRPLPSDKKRFLQLYFEIFFSAQLEWIFLNRLYGHMVKKRNLNYSIENLKH